MKISAKFLARFLYLGFQAAWMAATTALVLGFGQMYMLQGTITVTALAFVCGVLCAIASWLIEKVHYRNKQVPGLIIGAISALPVFIVLNVTSHLSSTFSINQDGYVLFFMGFAIFHGAGRPFRAKNILDNRNIV